MLTDEELMGSIRAYAALLEQLQQEAHSIEEFRAALETLRFDAEDSE